MAKRQPARVQPAVHDPTPAARSGAPVEAAGDWVSAYAADATDVVIVSPWLSHDPVQKLLSTLPPNCKLRVIFRWPSQPQDLWALSRAGVKALFDASRSKQRSVSVEFVTDGPLHAKVFVVDRRVAYVGSANFTGRGLDQNVELGLHADGEDAERVAAWVEDLVTRPLNDEAWDELQHRFDTMPARPSMVPTWNRSFDSASPADLVTTAFQRCGVRGARRGRGRNGWVFQALSREWRVTVHLSDYDQPHQQYHFEVSRKDRDNARRRQLDGLLYLCCERSPNGELRLSSDGPLMILVPFDRLFRPHGPMPYTALTGHHKLLAAVQRSQEADGWSLRIPNSTGGPPRVEWHAPISPTSESPRLYLLGSAPDQTR